jgi:hypothetical protein
MGLAVGWAGGGEMVGAGAPVYAGRGVIVLWAVLRGSEEPGGTVVVRLLAEDAGWTAFAVDVADREGRARAEIMPPAVLAGWPEFRVARAQFGERPRLEVHLARRLEELLARPPQPVFTVYFVGVPDTTPEITSEPALAAYFANALNRARARQPAVSPPR